MSEFTFDSQKPSPVGSGISRKLISNNNLQQFIITIIKRQIPCYKAFVIADVKRQVCFQSTEYSNVGDFVNRNISNSEGIRCREKNVKVFGLLERHNINESKPQGISV